MAPLAVVHVLMLGSAALALHSIAREVDRSDSVRAAEAVTAAFNYQLSRLEMVTVNNAVYTEAWKAVGGPVIDVKWAVENWTVAPPDLPGHHGILLLDASGRPLLGTRAGRPLPRRVLMELASRVSPTSKRLPSRGEASVSGVIGTENMPLLVAAANVVPEPADQALASKAATSRRLVLIHPMNGKLLSTMNETIGGEQLRLGHAQDARNSVTFRSDAGPPITLSWRSRAPGRAAMIRSLWAIAPIILLINLLLFFAMRAGVDASRALRRAATTDPLTQLPNRAAFAAELDSRVASGKMVVLGLIDLDGFKDINDAHGHLAGDDVLQWFGETLRRVAAPGDAVGRLGGDEFAFLCGSEEQANSLVEKLRAELARPLNLGSVTFKIRASVGRAVAQPGEAPRDVLARADADLYINKREQRAGGGSPSAATVTGPRRRSLR